MNRKSPIDNQKVKVWWIDDDHLDPKSNRANLMKQMNRELLLDVKGIPPLEFEDKIQKPNKALALELDLFLVDYRLNAKKNEDGKTYPFTGTAIAGIIRGCLPEHPIYLVSYRIDDKDTREQIKKETQLFDEVLMHKQLTIAKERMGLAFDAQDFRKIRYEKDRSSPEPIVRLLCTPVSSAERIKEALPVVLQRGIGRAKIKSKQGELTIGSSGAIRFARWVKSTLLRLPGLLYDDLHAATFLGMSEKYFRDIFVKRVLRGLKPPENPEYLGVFHRTSDRLWWKSSLSILIYSLPEAAKFQVSKVWEAAPELLKVPEKSRARCFVCKKLLPETVGYDRDDRDKRAPVHWRCSDADPIAQEALPHFEQERLLNEQS